MSKLDLPPIEVEAEPDELVRTRAVRRIKFSSFVLGALIFAVGGRGASLALWPHHNVLTRAATQRWDQVTVRASRGEILDRNGRKLATAVATPNIVVDPQLVDPEEVEELAQVLSDLLERPKEKIIKRLSHKTSRYQILARRVHPAKARAIAQLKHRALYAQSDSKRYYPEEDLAGQVIGFVNSNGSGVSGLEAKLDSYLKGGEVVLQRRRDRRGINVDDPTGKVDVSVGQNVHLTIDRHIQRIAERALDRAVEKTKPMAATAVVVDVKTGDLLAVANYPWFNPNSLASDEQNQKNHVVQDAVEPGSVFKPFTIASAMEEGIASRYSKIFGENGRFKIGRARIGDDHPKGWITTTEVLKFSNNIGTAKLALQLGPRRFLDYLSKFGFGKRTGVAMPGERRGIVRSAKRIKPIELATTSYGQGVTATPLQVVMAYATLANEGLRMKPRLVTRVEDVYGIPEYIQKPKVMQRAVSAKVAKDVAQMLVTVTEPGGTATRARVPGYRVAGKTGTAEKVKNGRYSDARIGTFCGFLPADDPEIAVIVQIDEPTIGPGFGGVVAAPAFSEIGGGVMRYLNIPPDPSLLKEPKPERVVAKAKVSKEEAVRSPDELVWTNGAWALPDLTGKPMRAALASLAAGGFSLHIEGTGRVVGQQPLPGTSLTPGADVQLKLQ